MNIHRTLIAAAASTAVAPWLLCLALMIVPSSARAAAIIVEEGDSIQDAVDDASPGDTIKVKPGIYTGDPGDDSVVTITKDDITVIGSPGAVIDATDFGYGIMVGEAAPIGPEGCPPITVQGFRIKGFTIQNADAVGLLLIGVDDYRITHGEYLDNGEYGPFPICSTNGVIAHNFASGHNDAAIYVGDDDGVIVKHNTVTESTIGIEIENSSNAIVRHNHVSGNTTGILVTVFPGLPNPFTEDVLVEQNTIVDNNRPNPIPPDGPGPGLLPAGSGIINIGSDGVIIKHNVITGNDSVGLGMIGNFLSVFDLRIEPFIDDNVVRHNRILDNGADPDPLRAFTPGADIVFIPDLIDPATGMIFAPDPDPTDNCFIGNVFDTDFPPGITSLFPCSAPF